MFCPMIKEECKQEECAWFVSSPTTKTTACAIQGISKGIWYMVGCQWTWNVAENKRPRI